MKVLEDVVGHEGDEHAQSAYRDGLAVGVVAGATADNAPDAYHKCGQSHNQVEGKTYDAYLGQQVQVVVVSVAACIGPALHPELGEQHVEVAYAYSHPRARQEH